MLFASKKTGNCRDDKICAKLSATFSPNELNTSFLFYGRQLERSHGPPKNVESRAFPADGSAVRRSGATDRKWNLQRTEGLCVVPG